MLNNKVTDNRLCQVTLETVDYVDRPEAMKRINCMFMGMKEKRGGREKRIEGERKEDEYSRPDMMVQFGCSSFFLSFPFLSANMPNQKEK